jgi:hypothetical protein
MLLFAAYGLLITQDFIAELLAFIGVFLSVLWRISQELGLLKVALVRLAQGRRARTSKRINEAVRVSWNPMSGWTNACPLAAACPCLPTAHGFGGSRSD